MVTYGSILYCTDFSTHAKAALPFAIDMARKYGASLHMVHVYQEPEHIAEFELSSDIHMDWVRVAQSVGTEAEKRLTALCEEVRTELPSCRFKMLRGKAHVEIMRFVRENNIDLIVIASHGLKV